jgi:hypothetical protein
MPFPALLSAALAALQPVPPPAPEESAPAADIVVTARPGARSPRPNAVEQWRRYCFDPNRRAGRSAAPPQDDPDWAPAPEATRLKLGLSGPGDLAFDLYDPARGQALVLAEQSFERSDGLVETRCTLVVLGGADQAALPGRVSAVMGAPGTERHVGEPGGVPKAKGWRQWAWTAMPDHGSKRWQAAAAPGAARSGGTFIVVVDPRLFYRDYDYVLADLKARTDPARPVSVLTLAWTRRAEKRPD